MVLQFYRMIIDWIAVGCVRQKKVLKVLAVCKIV